MDNNDCAYEVIWLIRRLFRLMGQRADDYLLEFGLSAADRAVMEFLYPAEALSVPEIAARYDVSRQHVQVTVNRLLNSGLLRSEPNPRHKRSPLISLREPGRTAFAEIRRNEAAMIETLFSNVANDALQTTRSTLDSMYSRLKNRGDTDAHD